MELDYLVVCKKSLKSPKEMILSTYCMKLKLLWDQYADVKSGTKCICDTSVAHLSDENNLMLMQLLMGLSDKYSTVMSNILMTTPLPSVMTTFNLVLQEEYHKYFRVGYDKSSAVSATNKFFKKSKAKNINLKCTIVEVKNI